MFKIAVIGQKGGSGKTTLVTGLAVAAVESGERVSILDTDPQPTARMWAELRDSINPDVQRVGADSLVTALSAAEKDGDTLCIIDTAGKAENAAINAAKLADIVLIPSRAQAFDMQTFPAVQKILMMAANPPAFIVYNFIHPAATTVIDDLKRLTLDHAGIPASPVHLTQRIEHPDAQGDGKAPTESEPQGHAATELRALYQFVVSHRKDAPHGKSRKSSH